MADLPDSSSLKTSLAPWLSVRRSAEAVEFYKSAFGAIEVYRHDGGENGVVARLSVDGAEFWVAEESPEHGNVSGEASAGPSVRMILTVADPDAFFAQARAAGAAEVYPVSEGHGCASAELSIPMAIIGRSVVRCRNRLETCVYRDNQVSQ